MNLFSAKNQGFQKSFYFITIVLILICFSSCKKEKAERFAFHNVLVLGNSITIHPPLPSIGWYGNWGMAASRRENDYCHILASKLNASVRPFNISEWEHSYKTYDFKKLDAAFDKQYDLILIRLGENVNNLVDLKSAFTILINYVIRKNPDAKVVITGCFWTNDKIDKIFGEVALENELSFVKLSQLNITENISSIGTTVYDESGKPYQISDAGVAGHPGDLGMRRIAETIYENLVGQFNLKR